MELQTRLQGRRGWPLTARNPTLRLIATSLAVALLCAAAATAQDYPDHLAATPPMGWNSWNCFGGAVDDAGIRAQAAAMVDSGLRDAGYVYLVIDDGWQGQRGGDRDAIQGNARFPDMADLVRHVRSLGLRMGIYSTPWANSYQGLTGSADHEAEDAAQWAAWGVDYLKYDWNPVEVAGATRMRDALAVCGRDVVYSLSNNVQMGLGPTWAELSNLWRTTRDITDTWDSMSTIGFGQDGLEGYAGPGSWNDPDMLVVGYVGWGAQQHPTDLTADEQRTHISLWALLAAPLMLGCDMTRLDPVTLALLTNDAVLEVNQDPAGIQGYRAAVAGDHEIWVKPLSSGALAIGVFNRGVFPASVDVPLLPLGLSGSQPVTDLWSGDDLGDHSDLLSVDVPPHGARLLRVGQHAAIVPAILEPLHDVAVVGQPFGTVVLTSGSRPLTLTAAGLPDGLVLEGQAITGTPTVAGSHPVQLTATNAGGTVQATFTIEVSDLPGAQDVDILFFTASDLLAPPGQATVVRWRVTGQVDVVTLEPALGEVAADDTMAVELAETTTLTLTAEGAGVAVSRSMEIEVPGDTVRLGLRCPGRLRPINDEQQWTGWTQPGEDWSIDGNPLSVGGLSALHGLGLHADSELVYPLGGHYQRFEAQVGIDDEVSAAEASVEFQVMLDGAPAFSSGVLGAGDGPVLVVLDVTGAGELTLVVDDAGDGVDHDHADWLEPRLWIADPDPGDDDDDTGGDDDSGDEHSSDDDSAMGDDDHDASPSRTDAGCRCSAGGAPRLYAVLCLILLVMALRPRGRRTAGPRPRPGLDRSA